MSDAPTFGWPLAVALVVLVTIAVAASWRGRVGVEREVLVAAARAMLQLAVVSTIIAAVLDRAWASSLFVVLMFVTATITGAGRVGARRDALWVALAMGACAVPVLAVVFGLGVAPLTGPAIIPIAGIVIGGTMTAHTLTARRAFDALRQDRGQVEGALALGFERPAAITIVIARHAPEALTPILDQTRTVGLVTLPGAFIGVLLGGGSAVEAASAQVLVLVGLLAAETCVVVASQRMIASGRIMPADLRVALPPR